MTVDVDDIVFTVAPTPAVSGRGLATAAVLLAGAGALALGRKGVRRRSRA
jgi:hypothetical protein